MLGIVKRFFVSVAIMLVVTSGRADIVTVPYVNKYITNHWGITIPAEYATRPGIPKLRFLLRVIDVANEILNGVPTSDYYNNGDYAVQSSVPNEIFTKFAVENLIKPIDYQFFFTPATDEHEYEFYLSPAGTFYIDWGDGNIQKIVRTTTEGETITHTYADAASNHTIRLAGTPTEYNNTTTYYTTISFSRSSRAHVKSIDGCLRCVFPTKNMAPQFLSTFANNTELKGPIPPNIFHGTPSGFGIAMFEKTFENCTGLTGSIPAGLFDGITGPAGTGTFYATFKGCSGLTGNIPDGLFSGVSGNVGTNSFWKTFMGCTGLSGPLPSGLLANVTYISGTRSLREMFSGCSGLTSIPEDMFGDPTLKVEESDAFVEMFKGCTGLTGPSVRIGKDGARQYLYERWPGLVGKDCYKDATGLSDWDNIPTNWGGPKDVDAPAE